jgi:hypothetical protein
MNKVNTYVIRNAEGEHFPEWVRTFFVDAKDEIYLLAEFAGPAVFFCAFHDAVPMVVDNRHMYLPASWMIREFPDRAGRIAEHVRRIRNAKQNLREGLVPEGQKA